jgi:hypothetical protein
MRSELFIGGSWRLGRGTEFGSIDPWTGAQVWSGRAASSGEVADAMQAAKRAFPEWARTPLADRVAVAQRGREHRPHAFVDREVHAHRLRHHEDVAEDDRSIHTHDVHGLQRHFGGQLGIAAHLEETARLGAHRAVFGQVASRLAHHPHRRAFHHFAAAGAQEQVAAARGGGE